MTTTLVYSLTALTAFAASGKAWANEPDRLDCAHRFKNLLSVKHQKSVAQDYFGGKRGPAFWQKPLIPLRQAITTKLRELHRRPYPIMAFDDGSPLKANYLARSLYDRLDPTETALDLAEIRQDLDFALSYVKTYPKDVATFVDAEATTRLQILALEDALSQIKNPKPGSGPGFPWLIELPVTQGEKVSTQKRLFDDPTQIKVEIKLLKDRLKKFEGNITEEGSFENRAYQQALYIKILETYRNELMRQIGKDPKVPVNAEAKALVDEINSIVGLGKYKMPEAYRPPENAFQNIQWMQLRRELKEFSLSDAPDLNNSSILSGMKTKLPSDSLPGKKPQSPVHGSNATEIGFGSSAGRENTRSEIGKFVEAIKNLSDEEKEALGLNKLGAYTATLKRGKWAVGAASAYTVFTQGPKPWIEYLPQFWQNYIASDSMRQRLCAIKPDDTSYADCVSAYIKEKHPIDYILQIEKGTQSIVVIDPTTKRPVLNDKIQKELDQMMKLRAEYKAYKSRELDFQEIVSGEIFKKDPTSDRWVKALVATPDREQFKKGLIAYFEGLYPLSFEPYREATIEAIDAPSEGQMQLINQIKAENPEIGNKLDQILYDRAIAANGMGNQPMGGGFFPLPTGGGNPGPFYSPYNVRPSDDSSGKETAAEKNLRKLENQIRSKWLHQ